MRLLALFVALGLAQQLPRLNINMNQISVSGVSSGAAFAVQFHISYSKSIMGVGVVAGPPYWCAQFDIAVALTACCNQPNLIDLNVLVAGTKAAYSANSIDDPSNIKNARMFYFTGQKDTVVFPGVMQKTKLFYDGWGVPPSQSKMIDTVPAVHSWPTDDYGQPCDQFGTPFINNCSLDMAGVMLQHIYSNTLLPRGKSKLENIFQFQQGPYVPNLWTLALMSMGKIGFIYVPTACQNGAKQCSLHIVFHGCLQDNGLVGEAMVQHSGVNEWAEVNNIVVLYPQTTSSNLVPYNPEACWDWWGYTGADYACKFAPQIAIIRNMIRAITGGFE